MKENTAGKPIYEPVNTCDCGLTGGCENCRKFFYPIIQNFNQNEKSSCCNAEIVKASKTNLYPYRPVCQKCRRWCYVLFTLNKK